MTTYEEMNRISKSASVTMSYKLHVLFSGCNYKVLDAVLDVTELASSVPLDLEVVAFTAGQLFIARSSIMEYFAIDLGSLNSDGKLEAVSFNDMDAESQDEFWLSLLDTEQSPMFFYDGFFLYSGLEQRFLASVPGPLLNVNE
jgi:hypothetical protein